MVSKAYLSLGSNLGDREKTLTQAVKDLQANPHIRVEQVSSWYETEPVGKVDQPWFLNGVVEITTDLSPRELLLECQKIENLHGRVRNEKWGPRTLDIDILLYDDLKIQTQELTIPHPRMKERTFVLVPLAELVPHLVLPDGTCIRETLQENSEQKILPWQK